MDKITIGLFIDTFYPMVDGVITVVDNYAKRLMKYADVYVFAPNVKIKGKKFDDENDRFAVGRGDRDRRRGRGDRDGGGFRSRAKGGSHTRPGVHTATQRSGRASLYKKSGAAEEY